jgi:hypothetical protein
VGKNISFGTSSQFQLKGVVPVRIRFCSRQIADSYSYRESRPCPFFCIARSRNVGLTRNADWAKPPFHTAGKQSQSGRIGDVWLYGAARPSGVMPREIWGFGGLR